LLYVSFFPQLVAGPIERSDNLIPQLRKERPFDYVEGSDELKWIAFGYSRRSFC
jgi:D-alanyl-lipoteichoic acid acyltransferase DltB (MBOAT superfamily)